MCSHLFMPLIILFIIIIFLDSERSVDEYNWFYEGVCLLLLFYYFVCLVEKRSDHQFRRNF